MYDVLGLGRCLVLNFSCVLPTKVNHTNMIKTHHDHRIWKALNSALCCLYLVGCIYQRKQILYSYSWFKINRHQSKAKIPLVCTANMMTNANDIRGLVQFFPAWGMCYSTVDLCMKGFPVWQTIRIRTDPTWRDSFCCHCTSHSHKWKHSHTNYMFSIFCCIHHSH